MGFRPKRLICDNFWTFYGKPLFFIIFGEIERDLVSQIESDLIWMHICSYWEMQFCKRYHVLIAIWINLICYRCFIEHSDRAKIQTFDLHFFQDWLSIFCVHSLHINAPFSILMPISGHTIVFLSHMDGRNIFIFGSLTQLNILKLQYSNWF